MMKPLIVAALSLAAPAAQAEPAAEPYVVSETAATTASAVGAAVPLAMLTTAAFLDDHDDAQRALVFVGGASLLMGPSLGHWYAGKAMTTGLGLRLGGLAIAGGGALAGLVLSYDHSQDVDPTGMNVLIGSAVAGGGLVVAGIIHDIATADDAARDYNRKHARSLTVAPTMTHESAGFAIAGTF